MTTQTKKKTASRSPKAASSSEEKLIGSLRRYIRTRGPELLDDPNVTSVGIGRKVTGDRRGKQVVLQFTVESKAEPEELEALGTALIPQTITVEGTEVPTDVIERSYKPQFRTVAEVESPARKTRLDAIEPGVSVGRAGGMPPGAGTLGCIVFDKADGSPYVLSNWHVLQGRDGELGDEVAQPGPHDDNRIHRNRLGVLKRSHLGVAGDCAVATIEDRSFIQEIFELGVVPKELGEPDLDDKVIKSGRTTGVTHGIVRRIDTIAKINYGGQVGVKTIGCFEIGPDPANPAADGEISMPGDSGAVWLFKQNNGRTSTVLAGLHFGGESRGEPDEHALACLPTSVFEKLEITLDPPGPEELEAVAGYDPGFLSERIEAPQLGAELARDAVLLNGSQVVPYTHFSLTQSKKRRLPFWVAWNIDGASLKRLSRQGIPFVKDPRLPANAQVGNELYENNRLDRGHIARRADLLWGSLPEAEKANTDSFFYTNITPQMDDFNQSSKNGLWGELEDAVFADVDVDDLKVSVFGGPVFQDDARTFRGVKIPREFWKVITFAENGTLKAKAFLLTQNLNQLEALELDEFRTFQITLGELEDRTHLRFPADLHKGDTLLVPEAAADRTPLEQLGDIQWG
ncbi:endonuclease G [Streptomyces phaeochromogenes]|uniref:DNA/RNA non-specific endonuclease n=1 Tax=Streptomyces phaeochromogenes TaxID=1923 RepID=UPI00278DABC4|nr:DNA/RNA non-specific endonuclease [Streptomyces phaeochromogenes]MDQ0955955.1 endonuclease G [Streptomyces phaeochromogenes]